MLVSAAAGSVGMFVGQIANNLGCRAIGIAGGPEKCAWVTDTLGFDACIDYKSEPLRKRIAELAPDGVDIYFDNVGGAVLEAACSTWRCAAGSCAAARSASTTRPRRPARAACPASTSSSACAWRASSSWTSPTGDAEAERDMGRWFAEGKMVVEEDILDGLENAPRGLIGLLAGDNRGKRMIRVAPDPA